jgi:hypothetical protein
VSLTVPLAVRLRTAARDIHIGNEVADLTFGSAAPGGFTDCQVPLYRPISFTPGEVAQFGQLYVYDCRTGATVWEGRLQDPGRTGGDTADQYQLTAVGGSTHLQDVTSPIVYVDRRATAWAKATGVTKEAQTSQVTANDDAAGSGADALILTMQAGLPVTGNEASTGEYRRLIEANQKLAIMGFQHADSFVSTIWRVRGFSSISTVWRDDACNTTISATDYGFVGTDWTLGEARPFIKFVWTGGSSTTSQSWSSVTNIVIVATRYTKAGAEITSGYTSTGTGLQVFSDQVIADLLGRYHTDTLDGANAAITAGSYALDQLAYDDPVTSGKILEDLMALEPYYYAVWETNPATDRFVFEWLPWPTAVTLEADITAGYASQASANTIFNRARVRYVDAKGMTRVVLRTRTVADLDNAGFTRTETFDLGEEIGTAANANQAGDNFLTEHNQAQNAGRLVIDAPILDVQTGRMIQPWEIRAGRLIRLRGVEAYPDSLNNAGRDGASVFRVVSTSFSASDAAATLELDTYAPSVARQIANLSRRTTIGRRR